jgi:hypothetical protein
MGQAGADISAVEIVQKLEGKAVDDFIVDLPHGQPDALVSACESLDGVEVLWLGHYQPTYGLQGDVDLLNQMAADPADAARILTMGAPAVFHADWALLLNRDTGELLAATDLAPDILPPDVKVFGPLSTLAAGVLPEGWLHGWGETLIIHAPLKGSSIILARRGGPEFMASEVARLGHLAALAGG